MIEEVLNNVAQAVDTDLLARSLVFLIAGALGTFFAYYRRWSFGDKSVCFTGYMFGDWHAFGRAVTTLLALCFGAGGLDYLTSLTYNKIIIAGAGLGYTVPDSVESALTQNQASTTVDPK